MIEQPVVVELDVAARVVALLVPEHVRHIGVVRGDVLDRADEVVTLLRRGHATVPVLDPGPVVMRGPTELGEPDRLGTVPVLHHQVMDCTDVADRPDRAVVGLLRSSVRHAHVRMGRHHVERAVHPSRIGGREPIGVVLRRAAENHQGARIVRFHRRVGGPQELYVLGGRAAPEVRQVRLVPDFPGVDAALPMLRSPTQRARIISGARRRRARAGSAVRPRGRHPQRPEHVDPTGSRGVDGPIDQIDIPLAVRTASLLQGRPTEIDPDPLHTRSSHLVEHLGPLRVCVGRPGRVELNADGRRLDAPARCGRGKRKSGCKPGKSCGCEC